jgi:hypothetical protein
LPNLKEKNQLEDVGVDKNIKMYLKKEQDAKELTGLIWLRIGTSGGFL